MTTTLEIQIHSTQKPKLRKVGDDEWTIVADVESHVAFGRALWVRSWDPADLQRPKDGKGFLVKSNRRLRLG